MLPSGSSFSFALRLILLTAATFGLAWLLECRLQPSLKRMLAPVRREPELALKPAAS